MQQNTEKINCITFQKQECVMKDIINKINMSKGAQEKVMYAEELQEEANVLFSCPDYNAEGLSCKNCRLIANLRKKTADLIIKVKKLE